MNRLFILLSILLLPGTLFSIDNPGVYLCKAVRLTQIKDNRTYTKGFQVQSLYLRFTPREVRAFGTHSKISICRKLGIRYFTRDTVYLEDPEVAFNHSDLKLYMVNDTIMGNVNLFDTDTSNITIKVIVKKLHGLPAQELEKLCQ